MGQGEFQGVTGAATAVGPGALFADKDGPPMMVDDGTKFSGGREAVTVNEYNGLAIEPKRAGCLAVVIVILEFIAMRFIPGLSHSQYTS